MTYSINCVDHTRWEWPGFDAVCPVCEDTELYISVRPVWATDSSEVYEYWCPICGVVDAYTEDLGNEELDLWWDMMKGWQS